MFCRRNLRSITGQLAYQLLGMVDEDGQMLWADPILLMLILEEQQWGILVGVAAEDTNRWHGGLAIPFKKSIYDNFDIISQH
jgi:hypothetical protein